MVTRERRNLQVRKLGTHLARLWNFAQQLQEGKYSQSQTPTFQNQVHGEDLR